MVNARVRVLGFTRRERTKVNTNTLIVRYLLRRVIRNVRRVLFIRTMFLGTLLGTRVIFRLISLLSRTFRLIDVHTALGTGDIYRLNVTHRNIKIVVLKRNTRLNECFHHIRPRCVISRRYIYRAIERIIRHTRLVNREITRARRHINGYRANRNNYINRLLADRQVIKTIIMNTKRMLRSRLRETSNRAINVVNDRRKDMDLRTINRYIGAKDDDRTLEHDRIRIYIRGYRVKRRLVVHRQMLRTNTLVNGCNGKHYLKANAN